MRMFRNVGGFEYRRTRIQRHASGGAQAAELLIVVEVEVGSQAKVAELDGAAGDEDVLCVGWVCVFVFVSRVNVGRSIATLLSTRAFHPQTPFSPRNRLIVYPAMYRLPPSKKESYRQIHARRRTHPGADIPVHDARRVHGRHCRGQLVGHAQRSRRRRWWTMWLGGGFGRRAWCCGQ